MIHPRYQPNLSLAVALVWSIAQQLSSAAAPLPRAHSHNDYEHERPLFDALDQGFCSVEADIYLVDGRLLVAHERNALKPERTLEALYLDPLLARCKANGGHVYPELGQDPKLRRPLASAAPDVEFTLLIDIKSHGRETYAVLRETLKRYEPMLTRYTPTNTRPGAVTVILSGDGPVEVLASEPERLCSIDGRFTSKDWEDTSMHLVPLVSESWETILKSQKGRYDEAKANGTFDPADFLPRADIEAAHSAGRRVRFWAVPANPAMWRALRDGGVDLINADDLPELARFLEAKP